MIRRSATAMMILGCLFAGLPATGQAAADQTGLPSIVFADKALEEAKRKIAEIQTELVAARAQGKLATAEILQLRAAQPPAWGKAPMRVYQDDVLGAVAVSRAGGLVYLAVAEQKEPAADRFFGRAVLLKEHQGAKTYYVLKGSSVRSKE